MAVSFSAGANLARAEKIDNFNSQITVNSDASISVQETIKYNFEDASGKHGIFRDIPFHYNTDEQGDYYLRFSEISVADESGRPYNFTEDYQGDNLHLKIGDPNQTVSGVLTYIINYKVLGAINYFAGWDELYWNATGNDWPVPIESASAKVILPGKFSAADIRMKSYYGEAGSTSEGKAEFDNINSVNYVAPEILETGQGLTVVTGWPKGAVAVIDKIQFSQAPKTPWSKLLIIMVALNIIFPAVIFIYLFIHWWRRGRDPKSRSTIIAQYDAPDNLTPAEVGVILEDDFHNKFISAEIINLAVKGYLKINRLEEKIIFFKSVDYQLDKLKPTGNDLKDFQKDLINGLFGFSKTSVKLSDLKDEFYQKIESLSNSVIAQVTGQGYFVENPKKQKAKYLTAGIIVALAGPFLWQFGLMAGGLFIVLFGLIMPARTAKGVQAKEYILGLKLYLSVAEADRLKFHNAPEKRPEHFEKLLPYAMILGVEKAWAEQFKDIYRTPPSWYNDPTAQIFNAAIFASSLNSFSSSASSTLSSSPAASGSSGFSGGSSGGGFGGGGGGSW